MTRLFWTSNVIFLHPEMSGIYCWVDQSATVRNVQIVEGALRNVSKFSALVDSADPELSKKMSEKPFTIVKREDLVPLCPHCEEELYEIYTKAKGVPLIQGTNVVYFCPHCLKVLGFGQGRMI